MTMDFKLPRTGAPRNVQAGDRVTFEFFMDADNLPQLTVVTPMAPDPKTAAAERSKP
jgi:Cu(I)/Ag(I) efflux system membrane fusion protein